MSVAIGKLRHSIHSESTSKALFNTEHSAVQQLNWRLYQRLASRSRMLRINAVLALFSPKTLNSERSSEIPVGELSSSRKRTEVNQG